MDRVPATPALPWRFPFQKDAPRQREVLRPLVSVRLCGEDVSTGVLALVDSGSEHILAAPWLAADAKVDLRQPKYETELGIGGGRPTFRFVDLRLRLQYPGGEDDQFIEWEAEVGFSNEWKAPWPILLGLHGFFDRFPRQVCVPGRDRESADPGDAAASTKNGPPVVGRAEPPGLLADRDLAGQHAR